MALVENHSVGQSLDCGYGIDDVYGDPAARQRHISDVQLTVGIREHWIQPKRDY